MTTTNRLLRVLVVEDNRHVAGMLHDGILSTARRELTNPVSFELLSAEDGRAALELLQRERFDLLIIDVYLPVIDGPQVIARVRGDLGLTQLPIIAVSAGGDQARHAALEAGATEFIDKPMRLRQLFDTLQRVLLPTGS